MYSIYILWSDLHGWNKKKEEIGQVSRHHLTLRREEKGVIGFVIAKWTVQNYFTTFNSQRQFYVLALLFFRGILLKESFVLL